MISSTLTPSVFKFEESTPIRSFIKDGAPWFVAKDICTALGLTNPSEALKSLDNDEKTTIRNSEGRAGVGAQCFNIINESGMYALVIRSNKPNARKFRKWITSEVIPAIRKTGHYAAPVPSPVPSPDDRFSMMKYRGVPVIPSGELRRRLGITGGQLDNWIYYHRPMEEGRDRFSACYVSREMKAAMIRAGYRIDPHARAVNLYTASGFAKAAARFTALAAGVSCADRVSLSRPGANQSPQRGPEPATFRCEIDDELIPRPLKAEQVLIELYRSGCDVGEAIAQVRLVHDWACRQAKLIRSLASSLDRGRALSAIRGEYRIGPSGTTFGVTEAVGR